MQLNQIIVMFLIGIAIIAFAIFVINLAWNLAELIPSVIKIALAIVGSIILVVASFVISVVMGIIGIVSWVIVGIIGGIAALIIYCKNKFRKGKK